MRQNGISVVRARKHKVTTDSDNKFNIAPNLLDRNFTADEPNQKWAGDISWTPALTPNWRGRSCRKSLILNERICEPIPGKRINTGPQMAIFDYINGFYYPRRRHSVLGWKSQVAFERKVA